VRPSSKARVQDAVRRRHPRNNGPRVENAVSAYAILDPDEHQALPIPNPNSFDAPWPHDPHQDSPRSANQERKTISSATTEVNTAPSRNLESPRPNHLLTIESNQVCESGTLPSRGPPTSPNKPPQCSHRPPAGPKHTALPRTRADIASPISLAGRHNRTEAGQVPAIKPSRIEPRSWAVKRTAIPKSGIATLHTCRQGERHCAVASKKQRTIGSADHPPRRPRRWQSRP